jgi:tetratricopeptide (TPR) repeat protein
VFGGLAYYQKALSLADSTGSPSRVGLRALSLIANNMSMIGNLPGAQKHATRAQEYAEALGGIYPQAQSLYFQVRCKIMSANYTEAQILLKEATQLLISCGHEGCELDVRLQGWAAEVHLLKTEYLESRNIQDSIAGSRKPTTYLSILANLNIALIDIVCGIDSGPIKKNLDQCNLHCQPVSGFSKTELEFIADHRLAELCLRDGDLGAANTIFTKCFASTQSFDVELATGCLERLADLSTGMNNVQTTTGWAGIFLVLALRSKDKLAIMKAFRCLGKIFAVHGDDSTALSLFNVALDGFTFMDVHRWRADCMVQIADIWKSCGEVLRAVELWKAARPLFERSSQNRDIARIDAKLTTVEASILEHYERQLLQLAELNVPTTTNLEDAQDPTTEEEDHEPVDRVQKSLQIAV